MLQEPALIGHQTAKGGLVGGGRMPERSQHRESEGRDARSERPAMGHGQLRPESHLPIACHPCQFHRCHGVLSERLWKQETASIANMIPR
jgi:hypothetical protein